ncbi:hypothetical protein CO033_00200 [Candidatus Nomurabacteria bacterium CG_4_9_14_0_2_um_filter_32_10]|nr:MAG: hypothetical protein CO033_00200 [Candidatus Nomurabacteria bacterium CG_4_9_14_0_2_um_filter_32_10]
MTFFDKIKLKFWHFIYMFFIPVQKFLLKYGIIYHQVQRQRYHIGWLAKGKTLEELKLHLHSNWGFGNHFVAWTDNGQVLSWRKLTDFQDQYHLRVFKDGEIRGHFEFTPEAHPIEHLEEKGEVDKKEDFLKFLGSFVVQKKYISHLVMDPNAYNPESEIVMEEKK